MALLTIGLASAEVEAKRYEPIKLQYFNNWTGKGWKPMLASHI